MNHSRSYILCATSRSGSTLLCRLLAESGVAGKPDSYFHQPSIPAWISALNLPAGEAVSEEERLRSIIDAAVYEGSGNSDVFGLRLMRKSFDFLMSQLHVLFPELPSDRARFEAAFGPALYIHLTRADKIAQAVSLVKANQSGLWHMAPDGSELERNAPSQPVFYDANQIADQVQELSKYDQDWERWFEQEKITPVQVKYEDLAADPSGTLARLLDYLGLESEAAKNLAPSVARLADVTSLEWIERYRSERPGECSIEPFHTTVDP